MNLNIREMLPKERDYAYTQSYQLMSQSGCIALMRGDFGNGGTNHYLYRAYKDGVSETQIDNLKEKIYRGTATRADITRITRRLGDEIAKVHGFPIPRQRRAAEQER